MSLLLVLTGSVRFPRFVRLVAFRTDPDVDPISCRLARRLCILPRITQIMGGTGTVALQPGCGRDQSVRSWRSAVRRKDQPGENTSDALRGSMAWMFHTSSDLDEGCLPALLGSRRDRSGRGPGHRGSGDAGSSGRSISVDVFIVSVFYRRLRLAAQEHWLGTALAQDLVVGVQSRPRFLFLWLARGLEASGARMFHSIGPASREIMARVKSP